jgi:D-amino-acid dehydrogenase
MAKSQHVVIVGAGLAGLSAAYYLQREGLQVTIVDRAAGPGLETSFANGALLHASLVEPWNAPGILWQLLKWLGREDAPVLLRARALGGMLSWGPHFIRHSTVRRFHANTQKNLRLAIYSLQMMRRLREETPISYDHQARGLLAVSRDERIRAQMLQGAETLVKNGLQIRALDRRGVLDLEPALEPIGPQLLGGIHYPDDEGGDAHRFCAELARVLRDGGADLRFGVRVKSIHATRGRIDHLVCDGGAISADAYLLAAGSYTPLLARQLGISIPVRPAKGYSITMPRSLAPRAAPRIGVVDAQLHAVVVPVGEDRVRVAGTAELAGYDLSINPRRIANLKMLLRQMFPDYERHVQDADVSAWTGLRPMAADGVPILGASRYPNLYLSTGHGHLGWTLAAGSGRLVADVVLGKEAALRTADYALSR